MKVKVAQSCLTLCDPMNYTVRGILQARMLEWATFPFSRGSSQPRDRTQVSCIACRFFTSWATREASVAMVCPKSNSQSLWHRPCGVSWFLLHVCGDGGREGLGEVVEKGWPRRAVPSAVQRQGEGAGNPSHAQFTRPVPWRRAASTRRR